TPVYLYFTEEKINGFFIMAYSQHNHSLLDTSSFQDLHKPTVAIVQTSWNEHIIQKLSEGAIHILNQHGGIITHSLTVPGSIELPFACRRLWEHASSHLPASEQPEAIIAFGTVIRGGTPHFDYVCQSVTQGITSLNLSLPIPVIFGVMTLENEQQAWERLGGPHGHKGEEAAITALKMIQLYRKLAS